MWTIAFIFSTIGSGINMLLSLRRPSISISSIVAQLLSYPVGKAWGKYMPNREIKIFGWTFNLNPGPFNMKEHTLIVVCSPFPSLINGSLRPMLALAKPTRQTFSLLKRFSTAKILEGYLQYCWYFLPSVSDMLPPASFVGFWFGRQR
jgi:OPT oligopeptide transporter protein